MPNSIRYNTSSESNALTSGNFHLGVGDVDKGPTSTTGYYNGINPPSGGYTIYLNKASDGPSIYTPANDTELISLTNSIGGQSFTTAAQCKEWFIGQNDKILVNREYENIVTDGLVFMVDAGFTPSYPGSGTSWKDLTGNGNDGTLTNGPTFDSEDGGGIVFDGTNDYVNFPHFDTGNSITVDVWFKKNSGTGFQGILGNWIGIGAGDSWLITQNGSKIQFYIMYNSTSGNSVQDTTNISSNVWYNFTGTFTNGLFKIYRNGVLTNSNTISQTTIYQNTNNIWLGKFNNYEFNGNISIGKVYTRALSSTEITQNFNSQKGRFGIT